MLYPPYVQPELLIYEAKVKRNHEGSPNPERISPATKLIATQSYNGLYFMHKIFMGCNFLCRRVNN